MTAGPLTRPNDMCGRWLRPDPDQLQGRLPDRVASSPTDQLTPTIGSRSAPGAASGTVGFFGSTGASRR
jgi:hypothetical protein